MKNETRTYTYNGRTYEVLPLAFGRLRVSDGWNAVRIRSAFIRNKSVVLIEDMYQQYFTECDTIEESVQSACQKLEDGRETQIEYAMALDSFVNSLPVFRKIHTRQDNV